MFCLREDRTNQLISGFIIKPVSGALELFINDSNRFVKRRAVVSREK